jgi:hypothetical protein
MPNRIIKESICTSDNVDALSRDAEVFFYRLIVQCDDYGRMDARRAILRARCYPLQLDRVSEADIDAWLAELKDAELVQLYHVDANEYLHVQTWEKHQQVRAKRSKYPAPPTHDSNRNHLISDDSTCPRNPIQSLSESETNPDRRDDFKRQYEAVLGMVPTASYPEMIQYMDRLTDGNVSDWWGLALQQTTQARVPGWHYMKACLESWLAAGKPSVNSKKEATNGKSTLGFTGVAADAPRKPTASEIAEWERDFAALEVNASRPALMS